MDDAQRLADYLPVSYKNPTEKEYINFLWDAFGSNYESEKYPFAFLSLHMLFMSFVYFKIWQIKCGCPADFKLAMVGFGRDTEKDILDATTPFALSLINESLVFRFFKLIGMENSDIGRFTKVVKDRNDSAHANGNIYLRDQGNLDQKIVEMENCFELIQRATRPTVEKTYQAFLMNSCDPDTREWPEDESQLQEVLIHQNYFSLEDIRVAQGWDTVVLKDEPGYQGILSLATGLRRMNGQD